MPRDLSSDYSRFFNFLIETRISSRFHANEKQRLFDLLFEILFRSAVSLAQFNVSIFMKVHACQQDWSLFSRSLSPLIVGKLSVTCSRVHSGDFRVFSPDSITLIDRFLTIDISRRDGEVAIGSLSRDFTFRATCFPRCVRGDTRESLFSH